MSTATDLLGIAVPTAIGAATGIAGNNAAVGNLETGINNASAITTSNGQQLQQLYNEQQTALKPYTAGGPANVDMVNAGLKPGGGLADPYGKTFSFTGEDLANSPGYQFNLERGQKAIDAARRAMGTRFSGGAVKKAIEFGTDYAGTKFNDAFGQAKTTFDTNANQFETDQQNRFNRLQAAASFGLDATKTGIQSSENEQASQSANNAQLAELQTQLAAAKAAGDLGKAQSITNAIQSVLAGTAQNKVVDAIKGIGAPAAAAPGSVARTIAAQGGGDAVAAGVPDIGAAISAAGGSGAALAGAAGAGAAEGALPLTGAAQAAAAAAGLGAPAGVAPGAVAAAPAGGGIGSAVTGLLTNPITIGVAVGVIAMTALLKSQAHWEANDFTSKVQTPFGDNLVKSVNALNAAAKSGQMTQAQGQQAAAAIQEALTGFEQARVKFSARGGQHTTVANQAKAEMDKDFGPGFSNLIAGINQTVAGLPAGA